MPEAQLVPKGSFALRFAMMGALLGTLAGAAEALDLSTKPSPPVFLETDISVAVWFIAPLAGTCVLGLVGLLLGATAGVLRRRLPLAPVWLGSAGCGIAVVYFGAAAGWLHAGGGGLLSALTRSEAGIWLIAAFLGSLTLLRAGGNRTGRWFDPEDRPFPALLAIFLGLAVAVCLGGSVVYRWVHSDLWIVGTSAHPATTPIKPNIILITLDTVRADHFSSYGYHRQTTPNLDRWAQQGVLFENAIAPSSWTLTSHATIFTGVLPHQHGANLATPLFPGPLPLAKILQSNGYETAGFSANLSYGFAGWGLSQGFTLYADDSVSLRHNLQKTKLGHHVIQPAFNRLVHFDDFDRRDAGELNGDVLRWFRRRSNQPYFLFINYYDTHLAYFAPSPFHNRFGVVEKATMRDIFLTESGRLSRSLSTAEKKALIAGYDNCLGFLDDQVGKLLERLAASPDWANTILIITSDHGEAFGEHERYGHGWDLHREVLHVPLFITGPGIPRNQRIAHLTRIREIFPTVIELALGPRGPLSRVNLSRYWRNGYQPDASDQYAISELVSPGSDYDQAIVSLMNREWHYIHDSEGPPKLYRWASDPLEERNLAKDEEHQGTLRALHQELLDHIGSSYQPWRGPEYLYSLDGQGFAFLRALAFAQESPTTPKPDVRRIGTSQAFFTGQATTPRQLYPVDEELLQSLPYH